MAKHLSCLPGTLFVPLLLFFAAPLAAQVTNRTIDYGKPKIVNFTELAAFAKTHPTTLPTNPPGKAGEIFHPGADGLRFTSRPLPIPANTKVADVTGKDLQAPLGGQALSPNLTTASPYVLSWFTGATANDGYARGNPPDASGVAGKDFLMETTSGEFRIYKRNGFLYEDIPISNFFNDTSVLYHGFYSYPRIAYDPNSNRFIICELGYDGLHSKYVISIAVTMNNDPTSAWYIYNFVTSANAPNEPQLGFNNNWIVISGWDYLPDGSGNLASNTYVFNKTSLYGGSLGAAKIFTDPNFLYLCPTVTDDPRQSTEYLATEWNSNSAGNGIIGLATITGTANAPVYSGVDWAVGVNKPWISGPGVAPQWSPSSLPVETGDSRITSCVYRNQSLWFTHMVNLPAITPTHSAIDWWQVDPVMDTVKQFGRIDDPTGTWFRYYPSMDVNVEGDMMLGFNASSRNSPIMNGYGARMASDPPGTLVLGNYITGASGAYTVRDNGSQACLWGRYTGTAADPTNNTFWTFQESANAATNWTTVVANITPTSHCTTPTGLYGIGSGTDSVGLYWSPVPGATSYNIRFKNEFFPGWSTFNSTSNPFVYSTNLIFPPDFTYSFQVQSVCGVRADTSGWSIVDSSATPGYCASRSSNSSSEYIRTVVLKTLNNTVANDGGYGDFTVGTRPVLPAGSPDTIVLTPGFSGSAVREYWTVYIDYNRNGVLDAPGEIVATANGLGTVNAIFTIPANAAKNWFARMRIQMHRGSNITNPCATLDNGDVQDYLVRISGGKAPSVVAIEAADREAAKFTVLPGKDGGLKVAPNPLPGTVAPSVVYSLGKQGNISLEVVDLSGRVIHRADLGIQEPGQHSYRLKVPGGRLRAGYYILVLVQDKGVIDRTKFIVQ